MTSISSNQIGIDRARYRTSADYRDGLATGVQIIHWLEKGRRTRQESEHREATKRMIRSRRYGFEGRYACCYVWHAGWSHISLGLHVCLAGPNIEIHIPFGFIRVGLITRDQRAAKRWLHVPSEAGQ
jgi:hypothetical protein